MDAQTAARHLGIQIRSLYAYVSRGSVRSVPGEHGRPRLYALADVEKLRVRRDARTGHGPVAAAALRWGEPVLDSAITAITPRGPAYRGRLATDLAAGGAPFEAVAELLWSGYLPPAAVTWPRGALPHAQLAKLVRDDAASLDVMPLLVQVAALADPERRDRRPEAFVARGRTLIPLLAASLAPGFIAAAVARALGATSVSRIACRALNLDEAHAPFIDQLLVLLADHELNASSFTARVTASTDADPYACISSALATLSGPRHGTASLDVIAFADEVGSPDAARATARTLRRRGQTPPGWGHPLYATGDPRTPPLLEAAAGLPGNRRSRTLLALVDAITDEAPSVDVGLAALVLALGAPPAAAPGLFAVARSAGWLAHALEQRAAGYLLRPRARYIGPSLATVSGAVR